MQICKDSSNCILFETSLSYQVIIKQNWIRKKMAMLRMEVSIVLESY